MPAFIDENFRKLPFSEGKFEDVRKQENFNDLILVAGDDGTVITANKFFVYSVSPYFANHINKCVERIAKITLKNVGGELLQQMITFLHTGEIEITGENVHNILKMAKIFGLKDLEMQAHEEANRQKITADNALVIRRASLKSDNKTLLKKANKFIQNNTEAVLRNKSFLCLDHLEIKSLVNEASKWDVCAKNELLKRIQGWVDEGVNCRKADYFSFAKDLKLGDLNKQELAQIEMECVQEGGRFDGVVASEASILDGTDSVLNSTAIDTVVIGSETSMIEITERTKPVIKQTTTISKNTKVGSEESNSEIFEKAKTVVKSTAKNSKNTQVFAPKQSNSEIFETETNLPNSTEKKPTNARGIESEENISNKIDMTKSVVNSTAKKSKNVKGISSGTNMREIIDEAENVANSTGKKSKNTRVIESESEENMREITVEAENVINSTGKKSKNSKGLASQSEENIRETVDRTKNIINLTANKSPNAKGVESEENINNETIDRTKSFVNSTVKKSKNAKEIESEENINSETIGRTNSFVNSTAKKSTKDVESEENISEKIYRTQNVVNSTAKKPKKTNNGVTSEENISETISRTKSAVNSTVKKTKKAKGVASEGSILQIMQRSEDENHDEESEYENEDEGEDEDENEDEGEDEDENEDEGEDEDENEDEGEDEDENEDEGEDEDENEDEGEDEDENEDENEKMYGKEDDKDREPLVLIYAPNKQIVKTILVYDGEIQGASELATAPFYLCGGSSLVFLEDKLHVLGGFTSKNGSCKSISEHVWSFDLKDNFNTSNKAMQKPGLRNKNKTSNSSGAKGKGLRKSCEQFIPVHCIVGGNEGRGRAQVFVQSQAFQDYGYKPQKSKTKSKYKGGKDKKKKNGYGMDENRENMKKYQRNKPRSRQPGGGSTRSTGPYNCNNICYVDPSCHCPLNPKKRHREGESNDNTSPKFNIPQVPINGMGPEWEIEESPGNV